MHSSLYNLSSLKNNQEIFNFCKSQHNSNENYKTCKQNTEIFCNIYFSTTSTYS